MEEAIGLRERSSDIHSSGAGDDLVLWFLVNTSQEIRSKVNGIVGHTAAVLDTALTVEQRGSLLRIAVS